MSAPSDLPDWATDPNFPAGTDPWSGQPNKVMPSGGRIAEGFDPLERPPAEWFNWILNNHGAWIDFLKTSNFYGDGSDGDATDPVFSNAVHLYNHLTITTGIPAGSRLIIAKILEFTNTSAALTNNGAAGQVAQSNATAAGGAGATARYFPDSGGGGLSPPNANGSTGTSQPSDTFAFGGGGGNGGNGSTGHTGASGGGLFPTSMTFLKAFPSFLTDVIHDYSSHHADPTKIFGSGGAGGGGGGGAASGGPNNPSGGGGGGGAGVLAIRAEKIILPASNANYFQAKGGNGGNGSTIGGGGSGGGGGGGGGLILLTYQNLTTAGAVLASCTSAAGGTGGTAGTGAAVGTAGTAGNVLITQFPFAG